MNCSKQIRIISISHFAAISLYYLITILGDTISCLGIKASTALRLYYSKYRGGKVVGVLRYKCNGIKSFFCNGWLRYIFNVVTYLTFFSHTNQKSLLNPS